MDTEMLLKITAIAISVIGLIWGFWKHFKDKPKLKIEENYSHLQIIYTCSGYSENSCTIKLKMSLMISNSGNKKTTINGGEIIFWDSNKNPYQHDYSTVILNNQMYSFDAGESKKVVLEFSSNLINVSLDEFKKSTPFFTINLKFINHKEIVAHLNGGSYCNTTDYSIVRI